MEFSHILFTLLYNKFLKSLLLPDVHVHCYLDIPQLYSQKEKNIWFGVTNLISPDEYVTCKRLSAAIARFDMDHGFDRAFFPYTVQVLRHMNFGGKFIRIIIDSHTNITTKFTLNGLAEAVMLLFSFCQGDSISIMLYLIYKETLLVIIGTKLQGIRFQKNSGVDDDYCDDVEIFIGCIVFGNWEKYHYPRGAVRITHYLKKVSPIFLGHPWHCRWSIRKLQLCFIHALQFKDHTRLSHLFIEKEEDMVINDRIFQKFENFSGPILSRSTKSKILGMGGYQGRQNWL